VNYPATCNEHLPNDARYPGALHPMEGGAEGDRVERPEVERQVFSPAADERRVDERALRGETSRLGKHVRIRIETDHVPVTLGHQQRDPARSTSDVEQATGPVSAERVGERIGESRRIREPALLVVPGGPGEDRVVPGPARIHAPAPVMASTARDDPLNPAAVARAIPGDESTRRSTKSEL